MHRVEDVITQGFQDGIGAAVAARAVNLFDNERVRHYVSVDGHGLVSIGQNLFLGEHAGVVQADSS